MKCYKCGRQMLQVLMPNKGVLTYLCPDSNCRVCIKEETDPSTNIKMTSFTTLSQKEYREVKKKTAYEEWSRGIIQ